MNEPARAQTTRDRDRAVARLRALTTGTAVAGLVATAGFGYLAATNYSGRTTAGTTTGSGSAVTNATTGGTSGSATSGSSDSSSSDDSGSSQSDGSSSLQAPTTVITPVFGGGRVSTGGSGG